MTKVYNSQIYGYTETLQALCKSTKQWGMLIILNWPEVETPIQELLKAVPYLNTEEHYQVISDEFAIILADTEDEIMDLQLHAMQMMFHNAILELDDRIEKLERK